MASLREIKDHIGSVRSTLKITSAMKLVSSAKLRKAQQTAEGVRPYTEALAEMLEAVLRQGGNPFLRPSAGADPSQPGGWPPPVTATGGYDSEMDSTLPHSKQYTNALASGEGNQRVAIVAVASNSSLCGAFNVNVVKRTLDEVAAFRKEGAEVEVIPVGRKMAEAMRKAGMPARADYSDLVGHCDFEKAAAFAQSLIDSYNSGCYSRIIFIYNHFVSTSTQKVQIETYLPFSTGQRMGYPLRTPYPPTDEVGGAQLRWEGPSGRLEEGIAQPSATEEEYILEPSREEILATLLPQVMRLRVYTVLMDSIAAEHAARMIAMQTATDNAEDLLGELTLEYNKGRQQKITSEILDLVGGAQQ